MSLPTCPRSLGVGIGLRKDFFEELPEIARPLDWVEVIPENFMGRGGRSRRALERTAERWPVIPHGVSLNLGGLDPLDEEFLDGLRDLAARHDAPFVSDHLCYSRVDGVYLHDLLPLPMNEAVVEHVVGRIRGVVDRVERPLLIENPTFYAAMPGQTMDEADFLATVAREADCGILLDVNNVYVNSENHGFDPRAFIDRVPHDRVWQVHLAGHHRRPHAVIDTHGTAVPDPVWDLYRYTLERTGPVSTLIEWDSEIPGLGEVLDQADRARAVMTEATEGATP